MPVDFGRVPPRVAVPEPPRPSAPFWLVLLTVCMSSGFVLTVVLWPGGKPTDVPWFWLCCLAYPLAFWAFALALFWGYGHLQRDAARSDNLVRDRIEADCHREASMPLAVLGHAWRFACDKEANDVDGIVSGDTQLGVRPSGAEPGLHISARWLEIPGKEFHPGNAIAEYDRHETVSEWLLADLIERITPGLIALPAGCTLRVQLCVRSILDIEHVRLALEDRLSAKAPTLRIATEANEEDLPLAKVDGWHDKLTSNEAQLLIAVQLRRAISEQMADGDAEGGAALLLARPSVVQKIIPSIGLQLHRPSIDILGGAAKTASLAMRWGEVSASQVRTIWCHASSDEVSHQMRALSECDQQAQWVDVGASIGNCAGTGAWLATALAIEQVSRSASPQLVLSQCNQDVIALVCKKQI